MADKALHSILCLLLLTEFMLLAIDIGNTATKLAIFDDGKLTQRITIPTLKGKTAEELYEDLNQEKLIFSDAIVCSVVPEVEPTFRRLLTEFFGKEPIFVDNKMVSNISINYEPPESLGSDRLVNASSATSKYGAPCIVCDFGTATTIDVINSNKEFLGGVIVPGINILSEALFIKTAKLPNVEVRNTGKIIENSTIKCIQSGIFHGYLGLVEKIISKMKEEMNEEPTVVATGGWAKLIAENLEIIEHLDENLTLEGLNQIFSDLQKNSNSLQTDV